MVGTLCGASSSRLLRYQPALSVTSAEHAKSGVLRFN
jgi:hypothetical protein